MKITIIRAILWVIIIFLAYKIIDVVYQDIHFAKEVARKEKVRGERMRKIRALQFLYKDENNQFASKWDSLLAFGKTGTVKVIKTIGDPNDTSVTVQRDTTVVPVVDSLFNGQANLVDSLPIIPLSGGKRFKLDARQVKLRGVRVNVMQVTDIDTLDKDEPPLTLGDMNAANYDLNREYK